jgi:hypothetical protein
MFSPVRPGCFPATRSVPELRARLGAAVGSLLLAGTAGAVSYNIDFGSPETAPSSAYAGVGEAGAWNTLGVMPSSVRFSLVDTEGNDLGVEIYNVGGTDLLVADDPGTSGDDEALMDEMFIGFNDPIDVCLWVDGLEPGLYEVITYAMTPDDPSVVSPVRVDDGTPGIVDVQGPWPGGHEEGITYARHVIDLPGGTIGLHSGELGGEFQSGVNGIQINRLPSVAVPPADLQGIRVLGAHPNPARARQGIDLVLGEAGAGTLDVVDVTGRVVWRRPLAGLDAGPHTLVWDGRDLRGRSVAPGVYLVRVPGEGRGARLVRLD